MAFVTLVLLLVIVVLLVLWGATYDALMSRTGELERMGADVQRQVAEVAQVRRQLAHYQANDARLVDELWNRAQAELGRAERTGAWL